MKVKRLKLLSPLFILAFVLALVMVAPPLVSPADADTTVLQYDDGIPYGYIGGCSICSHFQGVRFSLPEGVTSATVTEVGFYYNSTGNVTIHITGSDHETDLTTPIAYYVNETGWCEVDVSGVTVSDDFYVVIRRLDEGRNPAYDDVGNCGRSFYGPTLEELLTYSMPGNLLIRAEINYSRIIHVPTDYPTIQAAIDNATAGDTIIVHNGTYTENVNVYKELTIQAATGDNVTVQAANSNDHVFEVTADNVIISGFTVTGATGLDEAGIYLFGTQHCTITNNTAEANYSGIRLSSSSNNTISGNTVSGSEGCGIWLSWEDSGNTISGNTASNGNWAGIYLYRASNNTISDNTASDNAEYGICLHQSSNNTVEGNTASENLYGIRLDESSENTISNNSASGNGFRGILLAQVSDNNTVSGNTASENGFYGIELSQSDGNTIEGNTVNDNNAYGIYVQYSSGNTIEGNTASDNEDFGIYLYQSSGNTIEGNTANNNEGIGIYIHYCSGNTISDNIAGNIDGTRQGDGIHLVGSENNIIDNNTLTNNTYGGIYLFDSDNNIFLNNTVHDNGHGIHIEDSSGNWFVGNDIRGNYAEDSGVHLNIIWATVADNHIMFNNIVDNTDGGSYGVYNEAADIVDATFNWWGNASGPSGDGPGTGDAVSGNVTFEPWLGVPVAGGMAEDITGAQTGVVISGPTGSDTTLTVTTTDDVIVAVALYSGNPHPEEPLPDKALGKYIDIYASDPSAIDWPVYVKVSYTQDEVAAAGIDESTLSLYYWDASANEFHRCSDTGVDTDSNIIWANVTADEAGGLAGTPFAPGGAAPGGLSGGAIAGIIVGAIAGAVLIFFALRKWVWKS